MNFLKGIGSGGAQKLPDDDEAAKKSGGFFKRLKPQSKSDGLLSDVKERGEKTISEDPSTAKTSQMTSKITDHGKSTQSTPTPREIKPTHEGHSKVTTTAAGSLGIKKSPSSDSTSSGSTLSSSHSVEDDDDEEETVQGNLKQDVGIAEVIPQSTREILRTSTTAPKIGGDLYDKYGKLTLLVKTNDAKTLAEIKTNFAQYIDQYLKFVEVRMNDKGKSKLKKSLKNKYDNYIQETFKKYKANYYPNNINSTSATNLCTLIDKDIWEVGGIWAFDSAEDQKIIAGLNSNAHTWIKAMEEIENRGK